MPIIPTYIENCLIGNFFISDLMAVLLMAALFLLAISITIVRKLTKELPKGVIRRRWYFMGGLILLFFCGYLGFFILKFGTLYTGPEILVTAIFSFGAVFVLLVCLLAYRTTQELKRIYVLEVETITDPLLGIFNRRYLDRRIEEEILRARRHKLELSLLMVDIDNFKLVNDTWGHQIGDLVLKHLTQMLVATLRNTDIIARFGGEEFVVLLPHTSELDARNLAEKLRVVVEQTPLHRIPELSMTISVGSTSVLNDNDNAYTLLERADKAMYFAKREGRNRVISYSECDLADNPGSHP